VTARSSMALLLAASAAGCGGEPGPRAWFADRSAGSGVDFEHRHCGAGSKLIVEISGAGVSLLDYDGDGDLDLFLCQGAALPGFDARGVDLRDRLYRNDGGFRFTDVTEAAGAFDDGYTYAAMAPDVDGDGDQDLFLCNVGRNTLLRNDGGRFVDVTGSAGALACDLWTTSAAFVDLDGDGDLDGYLCNYLLQGLAPRKCGDPRRGPDARSYCNPDEYPPAPDLLLRNDDGFFVDVTAECLRGETLGSGLAVVPCDFDGDGDVDLFVSNDGLPNYLWRNDTPAGGPMRFTEVAAAAGVAVNGAGLSEACMGADFADVDRDGDFDLLVANLAGEGNTCYRNDGAGGFEDWSVRSGLGPPSLLYVGFGCEFADFDFDGDDDALVVNGHVLDDAPLWNPLHSFAQPPLLLENDGSGRFERVDPARAGPFFAERRVARGLALGDLDGDGDLDAAVAVNDGRPCLLENRLGQERSWIAFRLRARGKDTFAMGARVTVEVAAPGGAGAAARMDEVRGSSSFGAWQELAVRFGLGALDRVEAVRVRWPSGRTTEFGPRQARLLHVLEEPAR